jgi:hypothetical protein
MPGAEAEAAKRIAEHHASAENATAWTLRSMGSAGRAHRLPSIGFVSSMPTLKPPLQGKTP